MCVHIGSRLRFFLTIQICVFMCVCGKRETDRETERVR